MDERFLIFEVNGTIYGIRLDDVERILSIQNSEILHSERKRSILKIAKDEVPISKLCDRLKTYNRTDSHINAIVLRRQKEKVAFLVSGKMDIEHLDKVQKREVNFIDELADYIEGIGLISEKPVIILERDAISA
ncbi:hypothetical protein DRQ29_03310 [bacterium]|nr:MAG: hypothetical protein DRQ29_03310 [bacterium]